MKWLRFYCLLLLSFPMLEYNGYSLPDGTDHKIMRPMVRRITGLTDGRLSQLKDEIVSIGQVRQGKIYHKLYSMRQVLEYCVSTRFNPNKKRSKKDVK